MKKLFLTFITGLVLLGVLGLYGIYLYKHRTRPSNILTKAPDISITFLEGWSNQEIGNYLEKNQITTQKDFLVALDNVDVTNYPFLASKPKSAGLEGYIFPDTYFIPKNVATTTNINNLIIKKALDNFAKKVTPDMQVQAEKRGMDLYKILTLASVIEKETGPTATEKKTVAGIFYNRLNIGMPLQSDATVNFATQKNQPSPSQADTEVDSPYNTYKYKGLPPGPICNPSLNSIMAALYPTDTDYMYFLHNQKTGQAIFAKTYEEHLKNKQKYLD